MFTRRNARALAVALAVVALIAVAAGTANARRKLAGPGCALGPDDAINNAEAGDVFTPLFEQDFGRNTNGAIIAVNMEIEGGWSAPNFDCGGNSSGVFETRDEMIAAGLLYNPAHRSGLRGSDKSVLSLNAGVKSVIIRNVNLLGTQEISGTGGGLTLVGSASPRLSGAAITIDNSAFQPDFFIGQLTGAQGDGGGLFLDLDAGSRLTISDSLFKDQIAGGKGGGFAITVRGGSEVTIESTLVQGNRANTCGGGLITIHSGTVTLRNNTFQNNGSDGEVPDLCVERPGGSTGSAVLYLLGNTFSEGGLRIGAGITVLTSLPTSTATSTKTSTVTRTSTATSTSQTPNPTLQPAMFLPALRR